MSNDQRDSDTIPPDLQQVIHAFNFVAGKPLPTARDIYLGGFGLSSVPREPGRDKQTLDAITLLRDWDPDAAMALANVQRIAGGNGHVVTVESFDGSPIDEAEQRLNALAARIWMDGGGGADALIDVMHLALASYGGVGLEVGLTDDLRDVEDVWPFGPMDIEYRWTNRIYNGSIEIPLPKPVKLLFPAHTLGTSAHPLNPLQVRYLPLDPDLHDMYGRPMLLPALQALFQLVRLIDEMIQVARIHGYGMRDIAIDEGEMIKSATAYGIAPNDYAKLRAFVGAQIAEVQAGINKLKPTDTHVHSKAITVNTTAAGGQGINVQAVIGELSRRVKTALKTLPLLLGDVEGSTQTHATVQWQVYIAGIKAMQRRSKRLLEWAYNVALEVWGYPAHAHVEFNPTRETDRVIEATAESTELENVNKLYRRGYISHEEASQRAAGHSPDGPRPPTDADEFRLKVTQARQQQAMADAGVTPPGPVDVPGTSDIAEEDLPAPNGADAGITDEEGAAIGRTLLDILQETAAQA